MKQFYITSTITIEADTIEEAREKVSKARREGNSAIGYDLLAYAEVDENI